MPYLPLKCLACSLAVTAFALLMPASLTAADASLEMAVPDYNPGSARQQVIAMKARAESSLIDRFNSNHDIKIDISPARLDISSNTFRAVFHTVSIGNLKTGHDDIPAPAVLTKGRVQFDLSSNIAEFYQMQDNKLEQGWIIKQPVQPIPGNKTDQYTARALHNIKRNDTITVIVKIDTGLTVSRNGDRIDLTNKDGKRIFSYSDIFALDATGRKYAIDPRLEQKTVLLELPAKWLENAKYPIIIDPLIGSETSVGLAAFHAMSSTWRYGSTDTGGKFVAAGIKDGRGGGWAGKILSPTLSSGSSFSAGGTTYGDLDHHVLLPQSLVVGSPLNGGVNINLFDDSGSSINSFSVSADSGYFSCFPSVYSNSTHYLVVWDERRLSSGAVNKKCGGSDASPVRKEIFNEFTDDFVQANIYGVLVDQNGNQVGGKITIASQAGEIQVAPGVSSGYTATNVNYPFRDDFLVVWSHFVSDGVPSPTPSSQGSPTAVQSKFPVLFATRVSASGQVLDGVNGLRVMQPDGPNVIVFTRPQWDPRVSFSSHPDGDHFLVVWDEGGLAGFALGGESSVLGSRIEITANGFINHDSKGVPLGHVSGSGAFDPDVVWNGLYYYVVWEDLRNDQDVRTHTFENNPPTTVNSTSGTKSGGLKGLDMDIYGARVKSSLLTGIDLLDPEGFLLHRDSGQPDYFPEVAWNGTDFAVLWTNHMVARWRSPKGMAKRFNFYYDIQPKSVPVVEPGKTYTTTSPLATFAVSCLDAPATNCSTDTFEFTVIDGGTDWDTNPITGNSLPSGLSLSTIGQITGTTSSIGTYLVRIQARNISQGSDADYRELRIVVGDPPDALPVGCFITAAFN